MLFVNRVKVGCFRAFTPSVRHARPSVEHKSHVKEVPAARVNQFLATMRVDERRSQPNVFGYVASAVFLSGIEIHNLAVQW